MRYCTITTLLTFLWVWDGLSASPLNTAPGLGPLSSWMEASKSGNEPSLSCRAGKGEIHGNQWRIVEGSRIKDDSEVPAWEHGGARCVPGRTKEEREERKAWEMGNQESSSGDLRPSCSSNFRDTDHALLCQLSPERRRRFSWSLTRLCPTLRPCGL